MATMTKSWLRHAVCCALFAAVGCAAHAQDAIDSSLEVTIRLLPENAVGPGDVTRRIELPPAVAERPATPPADPTQGPPPGAENGGGQGLDVATEARERGRDFGQEVAEQARENRENAGRPDDAGPPNDLPSPPGGPNGPPATPPGRP